MSIYAKLAEASKRIGKIDKGGTNAHFKFKYQAWDDVLPEVRNALVEVGLWIVPSIESATFENGRVTVAMRIVLAHEKETLETTWYGEAGDRDDKAIQKAATSAFKYFLLKCLMIPSKDDQDTDDSDGAIHQAEAPKQAVSDQAKQLVNSIMGGEVGDFGKECKAAGVPLSKVAEAALSGDVRSKDDLRAILKELADKVAA